MQFFFSREIDSTTTNVRSFVCPSVRLSWVVPRTRLIKGKQQRHVPIIHFERFELKYTKLKTITINKYVFEDLRGIIGGFLALLGSWSVGLMALVTNILVCVVNFLLAELPLDGSLPRYKSSSRSSCGGRDDSHDHPLIELLLNKRN